MGYAYLNNPKYAQSQYYFEQACAASREHAKEMKSALDLYGDHGPEVSCVGRDHFPFSVKSILRYWSDCVTAWNERGRKARPKYTHRSTIHKLGQECAHFYGTGFYGYFPEQHGK